MVGNMISKYLLHAAKISFGMSIWFHLTAIAHHILVRRYSWAGFRDGLGDSSDTLWWLAVINLIGVAAAVIYCLIAPRGTDGRRNGMAASAWFVASEVFLFGMVFVCTFYFSFGIQR